VHPLVAAALEQRRRGASGGAHGGSQPQDGPVAAAEPDGPLGWPGGPGDGHGLGWPGPARAAAQSAADRPDVTGDRVTRAEQPERPEQEPRGTGELVAVDGSSTPRRRGWRRLFGTAA